MAQVDVLAEAMIHGEYHKSLHRKEELLATLKEIAEYEGDPVLADKAKYILKECTYLTSS